MTNQTLIKKYLKRFIQIFLKPSLPTPKMKVYYYIYDLLDKLMGRERLIPPKSIIFVGKGDFEKIGQEFKTHFINLANLQPDHRVLDVGCGMGRIAVALTSYLSNEGEYSGIDIVPLGIKWCKSRISTRFSNFHFQHSNIYNKLYNKNGTILAKDYKFPFDDDYFDFIYLISVFTHMLPDDLENYLSEISRVLKPQSKCLITFFLYNKQTEQDVLSGKTSMEFRYKKDQYLTLNKDVPESTIAYPEDYVESVFKKYGMKIILPIHYGAWCKRDTVLSYQDIVIAQKELPN